MSGFGIGIAVGLGVVIGALLFAPDPPPFELVFGFVVYSFFAGAVYESVKYMGAYFWNEMRRG